MFEEKIRMFMRSQHMYKPGDKILAGISGGKDSLMLGLVMKYIVERDDVEAEFLHINFGQPGSELVEAYVKRFSKDLGIKLHVYRFKEDWGVGFPEIATVLRKNACSLCSQMLRYYLLYFGRDYDVVATAHNLDDIVSFLLYNAATGNTSYSSSLKPVLDTIIGVKKVKPFYYVPEERLADEAKKRGITPVPTGCPSEDEAPTVRIRRFLKEMEREVPGFRKNLLRTLIRIGTPTDSAPNKCERCGMPSYGRICSVCRMRDRIKKIVS